MKASCIIPTFNRDISVVVKTIESLLNLSDEFIDYCGEIIVVDQNSPALKLEVWVKESCFQEIEYIAHDVNVGNERYQPEIGKVPIIHVTGLNPSLPIAKNYAARLCCLDFIFIFDDDVIVRQGCLQRHIETLNSSEKIGAVAGREFVGPQLFQRSRFRELIITLLEKIMPSPASEECYKLDGKYVARVKSNSFIFCRFDLAGNNLVEVDTVRGCYWSVKRSVFNLTGGFDANFQGALRDETDLCLRIKRLGYKIYFQPDVYVYHERQLGGCNNVATSYSSLLDKYDNEFYFQFKHFLPRSTIFYFIRLLPLAIEGMARTWGISFILHLQFTWDFFKIKRDTIHRGNYEATFKHKVP